LGGFRHSDWHQNATGGMPCSPKSLPFHYLKLVIPVPTISSNLQLGLHGSGMSSSLAAVVEAKLLAGSADFGSRFKESAPLAGQVAATTHAAALCSLLFCMSAPVHHCTSVPCVFPLLTAHGSHAAATPRCAAAETYPKLVAGLKGRDY
jgi:hypothetical protein